MDANLIDRSVFLDPNTALIRKNPNFNDYLGLAPMHRAKPDGLTIIQ